MAAFFDAHNDEINTLVTKFRGYPINIDPPSIRNWIRQFEEEDWSLALKILNWVDYYDQARVVRELQNIHGQISALPNFDLNNSYFAPFCRVGHSGQIIIDRYRYGNKLKSHALDDSFIVPAQLNLLYDEKDAYFFFLEDFIGTGSETFKIWKKVADYVPSEDNLYLLVLTGYAEAIARIEEKLPLQVVCNRVIHENEKPLHDSNDLFLNEEKTKIRSYCEQAGSLPLGFGDCQSNVIFFYRAPDNVISILRCNTSWKGLFVRNI